jgi:dTMP kinase
MKKRGIFITFEGIDGSGKSTQAKLFVDYLQKKHIRLLSTREPGGPSIAEKIREIILSNDNKEMANETELLLYMASRSQHTYEWIIPTLENGIHVICDRYYDSTTAYQGAGRKVDLQAINFIRKFATYGLVPDLTFVIDLPAKTATERTKEKILDRLEQSGLEFFTRSRQMFLDIAKVEPERFYVLDGKQSIEVIQEEIVGVVDKRFPNIYKI